MSEWREANLGQLAARTPNAMATGPFGSAISAKHFVDDGVPVIRGSNLSLDIGVRLRDEALAFLTPQKATSFGRSIARRGDLIFTCWGTIGQVGLVDNRAVFDQYVVSNKQMKLTPDPNQVDSLFLYYLMSSPAMVAQVQQQSIGAAVPGFNLGQLRQLRVRVPELASQRRIAAILGNLDDLIENNRRRIQILDDMAKAIYRKWFAHFGFPRNEEVEFTDSTMGPIPLGWAAVQLSDLVTTQYGYTESAQDEPVGPRYLRGMDINKSSFIDWGTVPYCPISDNDRARFRVHVGDVFVIRMADPGKVGICEREVDAVFASYLVRLRAVDDRILPYYLFFTLSDERYQGWITGASTGATRKSISAKVMTEPTIALPPRDVQERFVAAVGPIRALLTKLLEQNRILIATRDLLLPKLLTGQVDVSSLDSGAVMRATA